MVEDNDLADVGGGFGACTGGVGDHELEGTGTGEEGLLIDGVDGTGNWGNDVGLSGVSGNGGGTDAHLVPVVGVETGGHAPELALAGVDNEVVGDYFVHDNGAMNSVSEDLDDERTADGICIDGLVEGVGFALLYLLGVETKEGEDGGEGAEEDDLNLGRELGDRRAFHAW